MRSEIKMLKQIIAWTISLKQASKGVPSMIGNFLSMLFIAGVSKLTEAHFIIHPMPLIPHHSPECVVGIH